MEKLTVFVSKSHDNHEELKDNIQKIVDEINIRNGMPAIPCTWNDSVYQFQYFGTMIDGLPCMAAGAMSVGV